MIQPLGSLLNTFICTWCILIVDVYTRCSKSISCLKQNILLLLFNNFWSSSHFFLFFGGGGWKDGCRTILENFFSFGNLQSNVGQPHSFIHGGFSDFHNKEMKRIFGKIIRVFVAISLFVCFLGIFKEFHIFMQDDMFDWLIRYDHNRMNFSKRRIKKKH